MATEKTVCPNYDAVRYEPLRCRRVACPDCYSSEDRERAFRIALELEAYARAHGERPHALVFSVPPTEASGYSINDINTRLFRRGYRRGRRRSGLEGGYAIFHPARLTTEIKRALEAEGYGAGDGEAGYWRGVRDDVLELEDWRHYAEWSPHAHSIGFPEYIDPHEGEDYLIRKYDELEGPENVVRHARYLLSHRGVFRGDGRIEAVRPWGVMHHASTDWGGAEAELEAEEYAELATEIAALLGGEWSSSDGLHYPHDDGRECPECGAPLDHFIDLWDVPKVMDTSWQGGAQLEQELSPAKWAFFGELKGMLYAAEDPRIKLGDVDHPPGIAVWVDGDRPPP